MRFYRCISMVAAALVIGGAALAQGFQVDITVDENGNGFFSNTAGFSQSLPGFLEPDPGPGGLALALTYDTLNPPGLVVGDLLLTEGGVISDIIRFNGPGARHGGSLVFYSDTEGGPGPIGDTGFPTALYDNHLIMEEVGSEDFNGINYTPTQGQPGFVAGAAGPVNYHIVSDVPEPGVVGLLIGSGLAGFVFTVRRTRGS